MQGLLSKASSSLVEKHISLSSSRRETLVWLVGAMLAAGTTSLWRLGLCAGAADAKVASVYRRLKTGKPPQYRQKQEQSSAFRPLPHNLILS